MYKKVTNNQTSRTHLRIAALVQPRYLLQLHVRPEYRASVHVAGRRDDVLHAHRHALQRLVLQIGHENRVPVADDEKGGAVIEGLAGVLVGLEDVAVGALAVEAALVDVDALLGAAARRIALVDVLAGEAVVLELLAGRAGAEGAERCLGAVVAAEAEVMGLGALGEVAARALVAAVRAVDFA